MTLSSVGFPPHSAPQKASHPLPFFSVLYAASIGNGTGQGLHLPFPDKCPELRTWEIGRNSPPADSMSVYSWGSTSLHFTLNSKIAEVCPSRLRVSQAGISIRVVHCFHLPKAGDTCQASQQARLNLFQDLRGFQVLLRS